MSTCYIVGSGDFTPRGLTPESGDFVIAADGGYDALTAHGIRASLLMGDFDSISSIPGDVETLKFPCEKDDTDMGLAIREGLARGYRSFRLYGGSGDRPDHFIANLQLLTRTSKMGVSIALVCPSFDVYALAGGSLTLTRPARTLLSLFAAEGETEGVTLKNVKYPLNCARLTADFPLGVSNEFTDAPAEIRIEKGALWIFAYLRAPDSPN